MACSGGVPIADLSFREGSAVLAQFQFEGESGFIDLTGATLESVVRAGRGSDLTAYPVLLDLAPTVLDGPNGVAQIFVDEADAAWVALAAGGYLYDMRVTVAGGEPAVFVQGQFVKAEAVTQ